MPKLLAALMFVFALALAHRAEAEVLRADLLQEAWQQGTISVPFLALELGPDAF